MSEAMTDERSLASSPPVADGEAEPTLHRTRTWKRRRAAVRVFTVLTVVALVGFGWLGIQGYDAARKIKGGATAKVITDPSAPGYVAAVDASPVHLVALTDASDALSAFLVVVPDPAGGAGTIIWSLGELVVDVDGTPTALTDIYKSNGLDAARAEFEKALGFGSTDVIIVGPKELAAATASLGTITIKNPDPVLVDQKGKRVEKYPAGTLSLDPSEFGEYLTTRGAGEAPANRSTRTSVLFTALVEESASGSASSSTGATSASSGGVATTTTAPSSTNGGLDAAGVLASLGSTAPDFIDLPMTRQSFKGSYLYSPDADGIAAKLADIVQFPVSAFPGQRPRVRVLNGTADVTAASAAAPGLASAGGEVLLVGNAKALDVQTSSVVYSDDSFKAVADRIAEIVGVGAEQSEEMSDAADIDVVLGADYQR